MTLSDVIMIFIFLQCRLAWRWLLNGWNMQHF